LSKHWTAEQLLTQWRKENPDDKTLIFCSFAKMLDIAADYLSAKGYTYVKYTGSLSSKKRAEAVQLFENTSPGSPSVMLISTMAGGGEQTADPRANPSH